MDTAQLVPFSPSVSLNGQWLASSTRVIPLKRYAMGGDPYLQRKPPPGTLTIGGHSARKGSYNWFLIMTASGAAFNLYVPTGRPRFEPANPLNGYVYHGNRSENHLERYNRDVARNNTAIAAFVAAVNAGAPPTIATLESF